MTDQLWWMAARSGGYVAWVLLAASVIWGLMLSGRLRPGRVRPAWQLDLHRFLGGLATVFTGVHVASIVLDSHTDFGLADVLVPFASSWQPAAVAWGIVALYLLLAVEVTSLVRARMPQRWWRRVHVLSLPLYAIATVHLLTAGTDASNRLSGTVVGATTAAVIGLVARRMSVHASRSTRSDRAAPRPGVPAAGA